MEAEDKAVAISVGCRIIETMGPKVQTKDLTRSFRKETEEWAQEKITLLLEGSFAIKMGHKVQTSNKV